MYTFIHTLTPEQLELSEGSESSDQTVHQTRRCCSNSSSCNISVWIVLGKYVFGLICTRHRALLSPLLGSKRTIELCVRTPAFKFKFEL